MFNKAEIQIYNLEIDDIIVTSTPGVDENTIIPLPGGGIIVDNDN